jgi:hypothetical protein
MSGDPEEDEEFWFKPVWETEDEESFEPPGPPLPRARKPAAEPDYDHALLTPLAHAQDSAARLEAKMEAASDAVAEGLRAYGLSRSSRLAAARACMVWIDLALRDAALTGSYAAAAFADRLKTAMPATAALESDWAASPSDVVVNEALRLARLWRRLGELRGWRPLADADALRKTLQSLGCRLPEDREIADWLVFVHMLERGPGLIRAGRAARDWINRPGIEPHNPAAFFSSPPACGGRTAARSSPCPSGRRRKRSIIGFPAFRAGLDGRFSPLRGGPPPQRVFASSSGCARLRKKADCLPRRHARGYRMR